MRKSLTFRIFLAHFFILALPLYLATCVFFQHFYLRALKSARLDLTEMVQYKSLAFDALESISTQALYDTVYLLGNSMEQIKQQVSELNATGGMTTLSVLQLPITFEGNYTFLNEQLYGMKEFIGGGGVEQVLMKGTAKFIRYVTPASLREPILLFFVGQLIEKQNNAIGVLLASANIQQSTNKLLSQGDPEYVSLALLNQNSVVLASTNPAFEGQYFESIPLDIKERLQASGSLGNLTLAEHHIKQDPTGDKGFYDFVFQNRKFLAYRSHNPDLGFSLVAFIPKDALFMLAIRQFLWIYIAYFIVLVTGILLAYFISRWISKPLQELSYVMGQAHEGNLQARFRSQTLGYEFNKLGYLFNKTLETLLHNIKQAEEERLKKETYLREVEFGREVQKNLLSIRVPKNDTFELASIYLQAKDVGGDFYCAEQLESGKIWLAVGDAAGKGISSCLYSLAVRSLMRSYSRLYEDIEETLHLTNRCFLEQTADTGMFVTTLVGIFDPQTYFLTYYSCGHVPGIVKHKDGSITILEHSGMALGLLETDVFHADKIKLSKDDVVIFYTKGLVEAVNEKNQYFSHRRVKELLQQRKWMSAQEIVNGLNLEYQQFIADLQQEDEVVVLAFKIL
ncbi:MAG: SpoIIE family protein phosphatase [Verrucomicrobia bacterium]|nr:SpoIIE family protein phosphatase [Verrucomicrobiota bacterium]MBS0646669.1 SpoIIE family protein phosphatase [Verrucomicrobiota bacterium]